MTWNVEISKGGVVTASEKGYPTEKAAKKVAAAHRRRGIYAGWGYKIRVVRGNSSPGRVMLNPWIYGRSGSNPRRRRKNSPLTIRVGRRRHTLATLRKKYGPKRAAALWRKSRTKYHGFGKAAARCVSRNGRRRRNPRPWQQTRRGRRRNPRPWQQTRRGRRYGLVSGMGSVPVREQKRLLRAYHGLKPAVVPEAMRYGSARFRKTKNRRR